MAASKEANEGGDRLLRHIQQVEPRLISANSPLDFLGPESEKALVKGRPWWFGPDFHATAEALAANNGAVPDLGS